MATGSSSPGDAASEGADYPPFSSDASVDYVRLSGYRDDADDERSETSSRLVRVLKSLFAVQLEVMRREASADQDRIIRGVVAMALAALFLSTMLVALQVAAVCLLREYGLRLSLAVLAVGGGDFLVGMICLLVGRSALRKQLLPESRALVKRTLAAFFS